MSAAFGAGDMTPSTGSNEGPSAAKMKEILNSTISLEEIMMATKTNVRHLSWSWWSFLSFFIFCWMWQCVWLYWEVPVIDFISHFKWYGCPVRCRLEFKTPLFSPLLSRSVAIWTIVFSLYYYFLCLNRAVLMYNADSSSISKCSESRDCNARDARLENKKKLLVFLLPNHMVVLWGIALTFIVFSLHRTCTSIGNFACSNLFH